MSIEKEIGAGKKTKNDILLIAVILALAAIAMLALLLFRTEGDSVVVTVDGKTYGTYSLYEDVSVDVNSEMGYNKLVIKDRKAYVAEASCPDGICAADRPISYGGQSIICLPNKVVIEIRSSHDGGSEIIN